MNPPTRSKTSSVNSRTRSRRLRGISDSHNCPYARERDQKVDRERDQADGRYRKGQHDFARSQHPAGDGQFQGGLSAALQVARQVKLHRELAGPTSPVDEVRLVAGIVRDKVADLVRNGGHRSNQEAGDDRQESEGDDPDRGATGHASLHQEFEDGIQPDRDEERGADDHEDTRDIDDPPNDEIGNRDAEGARQADEEGRSTVERPP